jgi:diacylglycerol kinase family enzyme
MLINHMFRIDFETIAVRQLPPEASHVLIAMNRRAGTGLSRQLVERFTDCLRNSGVQTEVLTDLDEIADRAAILHSARGLRAVVAAGGDGTAAEIVNRIQPGVPIAVLPLGTENLLARYLGLKRDPQAVAQAMVDGWVAELDVGRAGGRLFLLMASAGFDADVVERLHAGRRGNISHLSYFKPILDSIRSYDYPCLKIHVVDAASGQIEQERVVSACWAFVFNLPCYGFGLKIAPWASGLDGLLDVCAFRRGSLWHGLSYLGQILYGAHRGASDTVVAQAKKLRIASDRPVPYQLDGDPGGVLPVEIDIVPNRLHIIAPRAWIESHHLPNCSLPATDDRSPTTHDASFPRA